MTPTGSDAERLGFSLRNAIVAVICLFVVRLGAGWVRGLLEGNYALGAVGLLLAVGPTLYLLALFRNAYF
jgi:hypothetical protein